MRVLIPILVFATLAGPVPDLRAQTQPLPDVGRVPRPPRVQVDPSIENVDLIMLRFKKHDIMNPTPMTRAQLERVIRAAGVPLRFERVGAGDQQVLRLPRKMREADVKAIAERIAKLPEVEYANADGPIDYNAARSGPEEPNDPEYKTRQWSFWNLKSTVAGANVEPAWDVTTGAQSIVIAVLDSGVRPNHPDLGARLLPGYDFVSDPVRGNDGNGRDADPTDPGDWVSAAEVAAGGRHAQCPVKDSSWHGTAVAGIVGATTNNDLGIAAIDWQARILPVRVSGKCVDKSVGVREDLVDAIRWAGGVPQPGIPNNLHPARVINLSLGASLASSGTCPPELQAAITDVVKRGTVVVAGAGNDNRPAADSWPANCNGVIGVGATRRTGARALYSNYGSPAVALSAPGAADQDSTIDLIRSLGNAGTSTPGADAFASHNGTSFAAPHVSGVAALMLALRPELKPNEVRELLMKSARPFVSGDNLPLPCTNACGAGMLDATAALRAARAYRAKVAGWGAVGTSGGIDPTAFLVVHENGSLWGLGQLAHGALGDGLRRTDAVAVPLRSPVDSIETVVAGFDVLYGGAHVAALKRDGTVWGWGEGYAVVPYDPKRPSPAPATRIAGLPLMQSIAGGYGYYIGAARDGTVWVWGETACWVDGSVREPFADCVPLAGAPVQVPGLQDVVAVAGTVAAALALKRDGTVWSWGHNDWGALGNDVPYQAYRPIPTQVAGPANIVQIHAYDETWAGRDPISVLALAADGTLWQWGGVIRVATRHPLAAMRIRDGLTVVDLRGRSCRIISGSLASCSDSQDPAIAAVDWSGLGLFLRADGTLWRVVRTFDAQGVARIETRLVPAPTGTGQFSVAEWDAAAEAPAFAVADLRVETTGDRGGGGGPVLVGTDVRYTVSVTNTGPDTARNVRVHVSLSAEMRVDDLPPNCSGDLEIVCTLGDVGIGNASVSFSATSTAAGAAIVAAAVRSDTLSADADRSGDYVNEAYTLPFSAPLSQQVPLPAWTAPAAAAAFALAAFARRSGRRAR